MAASRSKIERGAPIRLNRVLSRGGIECLAAHTLLDRAVDRIGCERSSWSEQYIAAPLLATAAALVSSNPLISDWPWSCQMSGTKAELPGTVRTGEAQRAYIRGHTPTTVFTCAP